MTNPDVIVVGSGPNGLAAAVTMARAGLSVIVYELADTIGGGTRTAALTLPGFIHDVCSAVHPMALASVFFKKFELDRRVKFSVPEISYAHAFGQERSGVAYHSLERTAAELGRDGAAWRRLFGPLVDNIDEVLDFAMSPILRWPRHPLSAAMFGLRTLEQGTPLWNARFAEAVAPALLTGVQAHTVGRMPTPSTAGAGLVLATIAHTAGWPIPIGGSRAISDALAADLLAHGGRIVTGQRVTSLAALPVATVTLLDTSAREMLQLAGHLLSVGYVRKVGRFKFGNAASKVDFALSGPVPWSDPILRLAPTVHVGGSRADLARSESEVARGRYPEDPYVLVSQPSIVDPSRAPAGAHVLWSYTHVPNGSNIDMTEAITARIEKFAPGFRDVVLASHAITSSQFAEYNPNYGGGDFSAGAVTLQQLIKRPVISATPYRTPIPGLYLCSSATPPGPGVHGMCGWHAANAALRERFHLSTPGLGLTDTERVARPRK